MANTKISQLTALTNPTGNEEFVYAYNGSNGKITLDTMKTYSTSGSQPTLVSGTNIKTINSNSLLGSGDLTVQETLVSGTNIKTINNQDLLGSGNITISGGGASGYDAIVDASGNGDYTTIGAAVNAGKYNLFIKNGNYTESVGLNVSTGGYLSLIGESRDGVVVTIPGNCDVSNTNNRFINMGNSPKYLYIYNIKFDITFTNVRYFVMSGNTAFDIRIEDCDFTYISTRTSDSYLFYCTSCIELSSGGDTQKIVSKYPWNGIYGCSFYTESSNTNRVIVWYGDSYFYGCKFTTGDSSGEMSFKHLDNRFDKCYIDVLQMDGGEYLLTDSILNIKAGGLVEKSNSPSMPNQLEVSGMWRSSVDIKGALSTTPTNGLRFGYIKESSIIVNDTSANIDCGGHTWGNIIRGVIDSYIDCNGSNISIPYGANNSYFYNCGTLSIGGNSSYIGYNGNYFEATNISISMYESSFIGNVFDGASSGTHGTISITGSYGTYLGNNMRFYDITDTGTDNIKANNVGQS